MQIHELTQASSVNSSDVVAVDTGSATYKVPMSLLMSGAVAKSGDTMTGNLTVPHLNVQSGGQYTNIHLRDSNGVPRGMIWSNGNSGQIFFRSINPAVADADVGSIYTEYYLPASSRTSGSESHRIYSDLDTIPVGNLGVSIAFNSSSVTLAAMYPVMANVPVTGTALLWLNDTAASLLSGGKITSYCTAIASRTDSGSWRIMVFTVSGNVYTWSVNNWTSASATPTINTVYKLTGTAI